ncbi:hypothetical protein [Haloarchaeobius amylolyticus]|uniref:hypothetical protein n=1 Tax=Haloarchaeobius amylolyticus TaxID=1198296 RepID=UPI002270E672|nr:hypothetical protein [Haloarchaeobius amylolyticus]
MNRRAVLAELGAAAALASPLVAYGLGQSDPQPAACPSFEAAADRTVCPGEEAPMTVTVETSVGAETRVDSVRVVVENTTDAPWLVGVNSWTLYEWTGTGWTRVAPAQRWPVQARLRPSARYSWLLGPNREGVAGETVVDRVDLERGHWAFSVVAQPEAAGPDEEALELVATYSLP